MVITVKVDVKGFDLIAPRVRRGVKEGLQKVGRMIERDARIFAPRDTGYLKSTFRTSMPNDYTVLITALAYYAGYVNQPGPVRREGRRPFMQPALAKNVPRIGQIVAEAIRRNVK